MPLVKVALGQGHPGCDRMMQVTEVFEKRSREFFGFRLGATQTEGERHCANEEQVKHGFHIECHLSEND
jgi:hypothetical protein